MKWHDKFNKFWPKHSKISNICTLMGYLWPKYIIFELKRYIGVMFDGTEYWCKIWRKPDLCFQKWQEEFGKFSQEHSKVSNLELWWNSFIRSRKCMSLKFTGEYVPWQWRMMQNWKRNLSFFSKLSSEIWRILTRALESLGKLHFNGLFLIKVYYIWAKKVQSSYVWWH